MHRTSGEIVVLAPKRLVATGHGFLGFNIQLVDLDTSRFTALCSASGPTDSGGCRLRAEAGAGGLVNLILPDSFHGDTLVQVELLNRGDGLRLRGAFGLSVRSLTERGKISVNVEGQNLADNAVAYQPIEIRGVDVKPVETAGDRYRIHVPLEVQRLKDAVPLSELTGREEPITLSEVNPVRIFDLHVGRSLIIGRCYSRDLQRYAPAAWDRLKKICRKRKPAVDWVTVWDDKRFNRILVALALDMADGAVIRVENLTDYSRSSAPIRIVAGGGPPVVVEPGETREVPVEIQQELLFEIDRHRERCEFLKLLVDEIPVGDAVVPVIRTRRSRFAWPLPEQGVDAEQDLRFLGLWIPQERGNLKKLLKAPDRRLWVSFPEEDGLGFQIDWDPTLRELAVASTVNLKKSLNGG